MNRRTRFNPLVLRRHCRGATRRGVVWTLGIVLVLVAGGALLARGRGYKSWVMYRYFGGPAPFEHRPSVTATRPGSYDGSVPLDAYVAADVALPNSGTAIDPRTVNNESVRLYRQADRHEVPAVVNCSGAGDAVVLRPTDPLEPNTQYTFEVNAGVRDTIGAPFRYFSSSFTTAAAASASSMPVAFEKVQLPAADGEMFTSLAFGPDRRVYGATMDGRILRFELRPDGTLQSPQVIQTIVAANHGPRLVTGICFDPSATAQDPVVWVSHGMLALKEAVDWTGKISRLSGPTLGEYQDVVVGLPRGVRDHLNNQPAFGPDGALYFCQASDTAMGSPDSKWGFREEHLLSGAILRLDFAILTKKVAKLPLDVKTEDGGAYDPYAAGAPLTIYATGIRNSYDLLWHSNGHLYAPLNGSAAGGNTPAPPAHSASAKPAHEPAPALKDVRQTLEDFLFRVEPGAYYGHPNPKRNQYVLNGGNPTAGPDPAEISAYPVGTKPEPNWKPAIFSFGKNLAPTGVIEYHNTAAFDGMLAGKMLVCRYSGGDDILLLTLGSEGEVTEAVSGVEGFTRLMDPLDIVEDPQTGNLYVSEFQPRRMTLLRPRQGSDAVSPRVFRQTVVSTPALPVPHALAN
jgi:hypothetical protein